MSSQSCPITQIVPQLPPSINGLGDYALLLARQLRQDFGIETHFIVGDPTWVGATEIEGFPISQVTQQSAKAFLDVLAHSSISSILVHYVGYGYAKRGCPTWFIDGLQQWKQHTLGAYLITMFHEVYASGRPPWTSAFWLFPIQKRLAARLAQLSRSIFTSKQLYADILQALAPTHRNIPVLPIFSTVGEPENPPPLSARRKQLVIFGGSANRNQVYETALIQLSKICQQLKIEEILDIGPEIGCVPTAIDQIPITILGQLTATEVSRILLEASIGFLDYNPDYLAKSGIFAAYCAHSLFPINTQGSSQAIDGLISGTHYWVASDSTNRRLGEDEIQTITNYAHCWYQDHTLLAHAKIFASQLQSRS